MQLVRALAPGKLVFETANKPHPDSGEVVVRTAAVGICGSDIHLFRGDHPYTQYPMILGHEAVGVVSEIGASVTHVKPGDHVVLEPLIPCGTCYPCLVGRKNCCSNMKTVGVTVNGALSEFFKVPSTCIHPINDSIPFKIAVLSEPFSIGFHAVNRGMITTADQVLIIGAGPIGLTILAAAKEKGALVMISDLLDFRLDLARKMGADRIVNSKEQNLLETVLDWTNGYGPSVVVEAVGLPSLVEQAVDLVADSGRVVVVGVTKEKFSIHGVDVTKKELSIIGSRNNLGTFPDAIAYLSKSIDGAKQLITQTFPFEKTLQAFEMADRLPDSTCKVVITLSEKYFSHGYRIAK